MTSFRFHYHHVIATALASYRSAIVAQSENLSLLKGRFFSLEIDISLKVFFYPRYGDGVPTISKTFETHFVLYF